MSLELICDKCGRSLKSDGYLPGSRVRCPRCGGGVKVPLGDKPPHETAADDEIKPAPAPPRKQPAVPQRQVKPAPPQPTASSATARAAPPVQLAPLNTSAFDALAAADATAFGQSPAYWNQAPARGRLSINSRTLWMLGLLGSGVGLTVMISLVAMSLWRSRSASPPDGPVPQVAGSANAAEAPSAELAVTSTSAANSAKPTPPGSAPSATSTVAPQGAAEVAIGEADIGHPLVGVWERFRGGQVDEVFDLRADGSLWWSVARYDGMSPPESGRWSVKSEFESEYILAIEHKSLGGAFVAKVQLAAPDSTQWTLPGKGSASVYSRRGAVKVAAHVPAGPVKVSNPTAPGSKPQEDDGPEANSPENLPPPSRRIAGMWDLTRPSRYKSSMISFEPGGTLYLLMGKAGTAVHMSGTWRVESEDLDQQELTLKVSLSRPDAKNKGSTPGLLPPMPATETKTVRDPGAEVVVRFDGADRLKIDFKFFKVEAGGDYYRRGTAPPVLASGIASDDGDDNPDETTRADRWQVSQSHTLPHTFEKKKPADKKNKLAAPSVSHPGCSYLHVTLEYLRGDVAPDGKDLRLVDETGRAVGFLCFQERVDKEPKQLLVVFQRLGEFAIGQRLFVEDRRSLTAVW